MIIGAGIHNSYAHLWQVDGRALVFRVQDRNLVDKVVISSENIVRGCTRDGSFWGLRLLPDPGATAHDRAQLDSCLDLSKCDPQTYFRIVRHVPAFTSIARLEKAARPAKAGNDSASQIGANATSNKPTDRNGCATTSCKEVITNQRNGISESTISGQI